MRRCLALLLLCVVPATSFVPPTTRSDRRQASTGNMPIATNLKSYLQASENSSSTGEHDASSSSFKRRIGRAWAVLSSKSPIALPLLTSLAGGYRWGAKAARKMAQSTGPDGVVAAPTGSRPPYLLQATVVLLVGREVWRSVPVWLKRQIPLVKRRYREVVVIDENDLTQLPNMARKFQNLMLVGEKKLSEADELSDSLTSTELQNSFLALLSAQRREEWPALRDGLYEEEGEVLQLSEAWDSKLCAKLKLDEVFELADWAYDELPKDITLAEALRGLNFTLVSHDRVTLPGCAAHYIAISKERRVAVIAIKGTSGFEDFFTDSCGNAVSYKLEGTAIGDDIAEIRCHEGVLLAAKRLADDISDVVEELLLPSNYALLVTGHSLGAGVATLLAIILRSRFPYLRNKESGIEVLAFAPPPILDLDSANACSTFTTTIVNNADVIPRASLSNLVIMIGSLKRINQNLVDKGVDPATWGTTAALMKKMTGREATDSTSATDDLTVDEISKSFEETFDEVALRDPEHLYVPGRVVQMYDLYTKDEYGKKCSPESDSTISMPLDVRERPAERARLLEPSSKILRALQIDFRMLADHMSPGYRSSIRALLATESSTPFILERK